MLYWPVDLVSLLHQFSFAGSFPVSMLVAFSTPMMPIGDAPTAPSVSAAAEKQRQDAANQAMMDATTQGRASTIVGGNKIAYAKQAGRELIG